MTTVEEKRNEINLLKSEIQKINTEIQNECQHNRGKEEEHHHNSELYRVCSLCNKTEWYVYTGKGGYWPSEKR